MTSVQVLVNQAPDRLTKPYCTAIVREDRPDMLVVNAGSFQDCVAACQHVGAFLDLPTTWAGKMGGLTES